MKYEGKKNLTRYEKMTRKELWALPDAELEEIETEHIEELKRRGDYNENSKDDFFALLDKVTKPINKSE